MAVEPSLASLLLPAEGAIAPVEGVEILLEPEQEAEITVEIAEDGSAEVLVGLSEAATPTLAAAGHDDNLAKYADKDRVGVLGSRLLEDVRADEAARSKWVYLRTEGLKLLGVERRTAEEEWASTVVHPLILRGMVQFQSSAIRELWPPSGPVEIQTFGSVDSDYMRCATRVKAELNYYTTVKMRGYRTSLKATLLSASFNGSAFRKVLWNPGRKCVESVEVPAEDMILQWGGTQSLREGTRATHVQVYDKIAFERSYADYDWCGEPPSFTVSSKRSEIEEAIQDAVGIDDSHTVEQIRVFEVYTYLCDCELTGDEPDEYNSVYRPHVVTLDETGCVRNIRRNWAEDDETYEPRTHFIQYLFVPGFGPYGLGLLQMFGGLAEAGTMLLRQALDANTLNNTPSGFKSRGLKVPSDSTPLGPGEFRDVDIVSGQRLADNLMFLPSRPSDPAAPSLLAFINEEAEKLAAATDVKASDASAAQTGAMLAVLERALTVLTATQGEAAEAFGYELDLLKRIIEDYDADGAYLHADLPNENRVADFRRCKHVRCIADPSASTQAQRVLRNQAAIALASQKPELYDELELHRRAISDLGFTDVDKILPRAEDTPRRDPISENMALLQNRPVKAFIDQDHQAHIVAHMAAAQDPTIRAMAGQSSNGPQMLAALSAHVMEHLSFFYRNEMEKAIGVPLPPPGEPLPADLENSLARMAAQAQVALTLQLPGSPPPPPDPLVVLQQRELAQKDRELDQREQELVIRNKIAETNMIQAQLRAAADSQREENRKEIAVLNSLTAEKKIVTDEAIKTAQLLAMTEAKNADRALEAAKEGINATFKADELNQARQALREPGGSEE